MVVFTYDDYLQASNPETYTGRSLADLREMRTNAMRAGGKTNFKAQEMFHLFANDKIHSEDEIKLYIHFLNKCVRKPKTFVRVRQPDKVKRCGLCSDPASFRCSKCNNIYYCCQAHQKSHWKEHKEECNAK